MIDHLFISGAPLMVGCECGRSGVDDGTTTGGTSPYETALADSHMCILVRQEG